MEVIVYVVGDGSVAQMAMARRTKTPEGPARPPRLRVLGDTSVPRKRRAERSAPRSGESQCRAYFTSAVADDATPTAPYSDADQLALARLVEAICKSCYPVPSLLMDHGPSFDGTGRLC